MYGLDYAGGLPGGAAIREAGYGFVCRYLTPGGPGLPGKLLTAWEYADLQDNGISVVVNFETTADRMRSGYAGGRADAQDAHPVAVGCGHPDWKPIYFSSDWDATPGDQPVIDDYLRGAASVISLPRVGDYGSFWVVKRCLDNGTATWGWQAAAWSGGNREPRAHIYQHIQTVTVNGVPCDVNEALQPDFGQHPYATHRKRHPMNQLVETPAPKDPNSDPSTWPQVNRDVAFDTAGGLEGDAVIMFGVQEWGGRTVDDVRGFLRLASWRTPQGLVPVSPDLATTGRGIPIHDHSPTVPMVAPHGAVALTLNFAAPGGCYTTEGRSA